MDGRAQGDGGGTLGAGPAFGHMHQRPPGTVPSPAQADGQPAYFYRRR
jgi:hypothetical protein